MDEVEILEKELKKKTKLVAMLAPCFIVDFDYPQIIGQLKQLGFDKVVELTFGAKLVNHEYHKQLKKTKTLIISTVCPGVVETIKAQFPEYKENLARIVSPMVAMGRVCKKIYPRHKTVFMSPCNFKKLEATQYDSVDMTLGMDNLQKLFDKYEIKPDKNYKGKFDKFYNDYTKIYPTAGGLSKTAHIKGVIKQEEMKIIDNGIEEVKKFLKNPDKKVKFLDANFCVGSCIGGPLLRQDISLDEKKKKVFAYVTRSFKEDIPETAKGVFKQAKGIKFTY